MIRSALSLVLVTALGAMSALEDPVRVTIDSGVLVGESKDGVNSFKGVPFAKPPVGRCAGNRRRRSTSGRENATPRSSRLPCPQPTNPDGKTTNGGGVSGKTSEDCLYLNVHAPANAKNAPVMVWLYGGASYLGGGHLGSYNAPSFAKHGVIIVTTNYRLGPLGGFAHPALTKAAKRTSRLAATR